VKEEEIPRIDDGNMMDWDSPLALNFDLFCQTITSSLSTPSSFCPLCCHANSPAEEPKYVGFQHEDIHIVIVEGFLLYFANEVINKLDLRIWIDAPFSLCQTRRRLRMLAMECKTFLKDPPGYFEQHVWPMCHEYNHIGQVDRLVVLQGTDPTLLQKTLHLVHGACRTISEKDEETTTVKEAEEDKT